MDRRIASIESFRALAILGVILWHTDLLNMLRRFGGGRLLVDLTIDLVWWVSLPYFFITAGYFFGKSVLTHGTPLAHLRRYFLTLFGILLAWVGVYTVVPTNWPVAVRDHGLWQPFYTEILKNVNLLATQHVRLFLEGALPVWHLWFLPALMFSLATLTLIAVCRLQGYVIPLIIGLYVLVLTEEVAGGHFLGSTFHLGLWSIALLFTALGWWLAGREQPSVRTALCLIVGGYVFAFMEGALMSEYFHSIRGHYYLGGIVLALGVFLLALAKPNLGQSTPLPFLAQFTLGIYVSHILVMYTLSAINWRLQNLFPFLILLWQFLFPLAVYFLAILFTLVLSKVPLARYLVTRTAPGTQTQYQVGKPITDKNHISDPKTNVA